MACFYFCIVFKTAPSVALGIKAPCESVGLNEPGLLSNIPICWVLVLSEMSPPPTLSKEAFLWCNRLVDFRRSNFVRVMDSKKKDICLMARGFYSSSVLCGSEYPTSKSRCETDTCANIRVRISEFFSEFDVIYELVFKRYCLHLLGTVQLPTRRSTPRWRWSAWSASPRSWPAAAVTPGSPRAVGRAPSWGAIPSEVRRPFAEG